ncbi:hypothetical protein [Secundilactobacillus oryzae]|nr:hypothetical protein [Secundilactobacillus oryzae]
MKSTGEVMGAGAKLATAFQQALVASYGFDANQVVNTVLEVGLSTPLKLALEQAGYRVSAYTAVNEPSGEEVAFAVSLDPESQTTEQLAQFALTHQIPLFTASDTVRMIAQLLPKQHQNVVAL